MTDNQRIEILLNALNFRSARAFAVSLDVNPQIFYDIKAGKCGISRDLSRVILEKYPRINPEWLLYGEGEMLKSNATSSVIKGDITIGDVNNSNISNVGHRQSFPTLINAKATELECPKCGELIVVNNPAILAMVPKEIARKPDINLEKWRLTHPHQMEYIDFSKIWGEKPFVVQIDTRAMEPDYREGTYLVLQPLPDISYARADGSAFVVDTLKPHTLFRNLTDKYDGTYLLTPSNDKRNSIRLKTEDIITVYDIVGSFRIGR